MKFEERNKLFNEFCDLMCSNGYVYSISDEVVKEMGKIMNHGNRLDVICYQAKNFRNSFLGEPIFIGSLPEKPKAPTKQHDYKQRAKKFIEVIAGVNLDNVGCAPSHFYESILENFVDIGAVKLTNHTT